MTNRLRLSEYLFVVEVLLVLLAIDGAIRCRGFASCYNLLRRWPHKSPPPVDSWPRAQRIAHIVMWTNSHCLPLPTLCLTRSLALAWILRRRGLPGELCLGVRNSTGAFEAHAWVEVDGLVLAETDDVAHLYEAFELTV